VSSFEIKRNVKKSELKFPEIYSDLVIVMDCRGSIEQIRSNNAEMLIAPESKIIGEKVSSFVPPEIKSFLSGFFEGPVRKGIVQSGLKYVVNINGIDQDFSCELLGIDDANKEEKRWLALINRLDIDKDASLDWRLRAKNRLMFGIAEASDDLLSVTAVRHH